ncbi:MAG: bifunctional methylenetetrahydrofolate dehydrogenase/methenyltetrahydrofolate cyclohydrolase FolD [Betaproteobacteria bacterium]|nr:bifunctional methylenetetrahydrofolate dehydrogenase/methenyltetrahydrofolate cyclohydrolase FolD [Betaproteobacteria bacterium]
MAAKIIDGKAVARELRAEWKARAGCLRARGIYPGLAVILVGDNLASRVYVRNKVNACREVGIHSELHEFPAGVPEEAVIFRIRQLNANRTIHGILVQLPLPRHIDNRRVLEAISPEKDVDGFHLYNVGALVAGSAVFPPCTPYGVMRLLQHAGIAVEGKHAVVVGRSNIVGKPMALMLLEAGATVTICTSKTRDLADHTGRADILVVATGRPKLVSGDMVKDGVVVIDVGINRLPDGRLVGDVDYESVARKASHITPVPGGVGPMTVTMLLVNTIDAAERDARCAPPAETGCRRSPAITA